VTIAEGVETAEQFKYVNDIGIDCMQGFLLSKPVAEEEITGIIEKNNRGMLFYGVQL
jgi:EAL domain-containing protein (putative c-di-GMP-specific phosphodiesterase class I)